MYRIYYMYYNIQQVQKVIRPLLLFIHFIINTGFLN